MSRKTKNRASKLTKAHKRLLDNINDDYDDYPMKKKNRGMKSQHEYAQFEKEVTSDKFTYQAEPINPKTQNQADYLYSLCDDSIPCVIVSGPAGTGKTYVSTSCAVDALLSGKYEKIIITRPIQEAAKNGKIGFLPGNLMEKTEPYFRPVRDVIEERIGVGRTKYLLEKGIIEFQSLELLRGANFNHSFIIADEMQNCTKGQIELILSRLGEGSKICLDGDIAQADITNSGLEDCIKRFKNSKYVDHIEFGIDDIVRSGFCKEVILRYRD